MPLTAEVKDTMLDIMTPFFVTMYLVQDLGNNIELGNLVGATVVQNNILDGGKTVTWGAAALSEVATTNSATSNPLNFSIPINKTVGRILLTNAGTEALRVVGGIIEIPAPKPLYSTGDGAYYVRGLDITLTEV